MKLVRESDRSVGEICKDLDLSQTAVRRWLKQAEIDAGKGAAGRALQMGLGSRLFRTRLLSASRSSRYRGGYSFFTRSKNRTNSCAGTAGLQRCP